jgi:hypothetical protein
MARFTTFIALLLATVVSAQEAPKVGDEALGTQSYDAFERPAVCASCHVDIARQHEQAMMSQAYTHHWDEIEYFELAVPHAEKDAKVAGVKAGCNGCHAPIAFLAGDVPPPRPDEGSRANESVSCDFCHTVTGFVGDVPHNFNWISEPGKIKQGNRPGLESPHHKTKENGFFRTAEFCGTCHNEMSPYGVWVKATQIEWTKGPQGKGGIVCQDCHMPPAPGRSAKMGSELSDMRQHLFHGAHDPGKVRGVIEVRIHPRLREVMFDEPVQLEAILVNGKAGHPVPSGSVEDRIVWLDVQATDSAGTVYHLPVDAKGFEGEEYTIADERAMGYQDIGDIKGLADFAGLKRDGDVPSGDRIFRMAYFDPQGRITISQWNTASLGHDYRLWPLEAKAETFTWRMPENIPLGDVTVTATVYYSRLVSSVAEYLKVPAEEYEPIEVNSHTTTFTVVD